MSIKKTIQVDGMSCEHCAARVKDALEAIEQIKSATVNLKKKEVKIKMNEEVSQDVIVKAVADAGYQVM